MLKFKVSGEKLLKMEKRRRIVNFVVVTLVGVHAFQTYQIQTSAHEHKNLRERTEARYQSFVNKLHSDTWLKGLEEHITNKSNAELRSYVKGIYGSIDPTWEGGGNGNYIPGLGPVI
mmetsp:Transcript_19850/g.28538  ORF Transcript_19850/g.28538 Transcript_19850/m.28538 type:complete len:117 (-) Transcript_19850:85-435(-)